MWIINRDPRLQKKRTPKRASSYIRRMEITKPICFPSSIWFVDCLFPFLVPEKDDDKVHIHCPNDPSEGVLIAIMKCKTGYHPGSHYDVPIRLVVNYAVNLTVVDSTVYVENSRIDTVDIFGKSLLIEGANTTIQRVGLDNTSEFNSYADQQKKKTR